MSDELWVILGIVTMLLSLMGMGAIVGFAWGHHIGSLSGRTNLAGKVADGRAEA